MKLRNGGGLANHKMVEGLRKPPKGNEKLGEIMKTSKRDAILLLVKYCQA
jgi:hypothetical protein